MTQDPYPYGQHPSQPTPPHSGQPDQPGQYGQQPGAEDPTTPLYRPAAPEAAGYGQPGEHAQPGGYGQPSSHGQPGGYAPPGAPGYGQPAAPGYGQPTPGYGQSATPGYGQPATPGYGQPTPRYGNSPYGTGGVPPGWPAPPGGPAPAKKKRTGLVVGLIAGGLVLLLCLVGVGFVAFRALDTPTDPVANPSGPPESTEPNGPDPGDPFANSPAADFAVGEAGIILPEAEAVGDFSRSEVADTLEMVREALIQLRIDPQMLHEHDPEPFLDLLSPDNADFLEEQFEKNEFGYFATQLADDAQLLEPEPRVQGEITFEATTDDQGIRVIEVVTSFVWAYAFVPPADLPGIDGIVVVRDELVWQLPHEDDVTESSRGLWLWDGESYAWGIDCDAFDQSLLAPQSQLSSGFGGPDEDDIYDPDRPLDYPDTC
jgi:hypothetical protein